MSIQPKRKERISATLRQSIWNRYIGIELGQVLCPYCNINSISPFSFQAGHVISEKTGGVVSEENLRPICGLCNISMGTKQLDLKLYRKKNEIKQNLPTKDTFSQKHYPTTIDSRIAFIEINSLTNLHGKVNQPLRKLKRREMEAIAKKKWIAFTEVFEMSFDPKEQVSRPVLVKPGLEFSIYNVQTIELMIQDQFRTRWGKMKRKIFGR